MKACSSSLAAAEQLVREGVPLVVIGSTALALQGVPLESAPHDVDVIVADASLARACALLVAAGFSLSVWGDPLDVPFDHARVAGKQYVRARRDDDQIDLVFAPLPDRLVALLESPIPVGPLAVARASAIVRALAESDRPEDRARAERLRSVVPVT